MRPNLRLSKGFTKYKEQRMENNKYIRLLKDIKRKTRNLDQVKCIKDDEG